jgi:hypothetical protein
VTIVIECRDIYHNGKIRLVRILCEYVFFVSRRQQTVVSSPKPFKGKDLFVDFGPECRRQFRHEWLWVS